MVIRTASPQDMDSIIELERACGAAAHWTRDQYRALLQSEAGNHRLVLLAETGERNLLGFLVAQHVDSEWELENIVVSDAERRRGIGSQLFGALLESARKGNGHSIFLEVRDSNAPARLFYERAGFRQTGRRKHYYSEPDEDALLYFLHLR
jgi:[ribosomal protein S18]-alanine N-acetyltransferase